MLWLIFYIFTLDIKFIKNQHFKQIHQIEQIVLTRVLAPGNEIMTSWFQMSAAMLPYSCVGFL